MRDSRIKTLAVRLLFSVLAINWWGFVFAQPSSQDIALFEDVGFNIEAFQFDASPITSSDGSVRNPIIVLSDETGAVLERLSLREGMHIFNVSNSNPSAEPRSARNDPVALLRVFAMAEPGDLLRFATIDPTTGRERFHETVRISQAEFGQDRLAETQFREVRVDPFFDLSTFYGFRLQLLLNGAFEALDAQLEIDLSEFRRRSLAPAPGTSISTVMEAAAPIAELDNYGGLILAYALARASILGLCGESGVVFEESLEFTTQLRNGLGMNIGLPNTSRTTWTFTVPASFGLLADRASSLRLTQNSQDLVSAVQLLECDSDLRARLEGNMRAYYYR